MRTIYKQEVITEHGELKRTTIVKAGKIEYYYSQINDEVASEIMQLTGLELKLLIILEISATPSTNEPAVKKRDVQHILKVMNISKRTYYNLRYTLKKKGMLIDHREVVIVNPLYFWRGSMVDRETLLDEIREDRLAS